MYSTICNRSYCKTITARIYSCIFVLPNLMDNTTPINYDLVIAEAIDCQSDQLVNGTCTFNVNEAIGIKKSNPHDSVWIVVQDVILAGTSFIGTVLVLALITSGIMMILWGSSGSSSMASNGKKWVLYSIIWLILVLSSYAIIRLVQFVARG